MTLNSSFKNCHGKKYISTLLLMSPRSWRQFLEKNIKTVRLWFVSNIYTGIIMKQPHKTGTKKVGIWRATHADEWKSKTTCSHQIQTLNFIEWQK